MFGIRYLSFFSWSNMRNALRGIIPGSVNPVSSINISVIIQESVTAIGMIGLTSFQILGATRMQQGIITSKRQQQQQALAAQSLNGPVMYLRQQNRLLPGQSSQRYLGMLIIQGHPQLVIIIRLWMWKDWKEFVRKLKKKQPVPVLRMEEKKVLHFGDFTPILLNQQGADNQIVNTISSINIIMEHIKDSEQDLYRLLKLYQILSQEQINMSDLFHCFYNSISYQYYPIRSLVWKILVGYLPDRKNKWITFMENNKKNYQRLLIDNLAATIRKRPSEDRKSDSKEQKEDKEDKEPTAEKLKVTNTNECKDHPLNRNSGSQWNTYFKDIELWNKIQKDVLRTRKSVNFFQVEHEYQFEHQQFTGSLNLSKNRPSYHYDAISRILFLYAKLHPKQGYCQGMNQIAALLYFSFTNLNTEYQRRVSQSDAYFCFQIVMKRIGYSNFASNEMLSARVQVLCQCIKKIDPKLSEVLAVAKIDIKLFAMRWFMVYMLQEFDVNNSLLIWDGLFCAEVGMSKYLYYICLAVLFIKREALMQTPTTIYQIQKLDLKPQVILETANNLYREYPNLQLV